MIKEFVQSRGIKSIYHFTRVDNLPSILESGLLPVDELKKRGIEYVSNDSMRLDGHCDALCSSIGYPNYSMFYKYRINNPASVWAIIEIKPDILWEKSCGFCWDNAASYIETIIPLQEKTSFMALKNMFADQPGYSRSGLGIPDYYPTNPQAEVLVFGKVEPGYFKRVLFNNASIANEYRIKYGAKLELNFVYDKQYFDSRVDYNFWRNGNGYTSRICG